MIAKHDLIDAASPHVPSTARLHARVRTSAALAQASPRARNHVLQSLWFQSLLSLLSVLSLPALHP
jgi:predicted transcriptional regulator